VRIKISARKSDLARLQAYQVGDALKKCHDHLEVVYQFRASLGDQNQDDPLWKMPSKGVFTEDFKSDLLSGESDMVVHSWKDLPTGLGDETAIAGTLPRADSRDLLLFKKSSLGKSHLNFLSSSPRRSWNLKHLLPQLLPFSVSSLDFLTVRGNVQTRIRKLLENANADGLVVAKAALDRLLSATQNEFQETRNFIAASLSELQFMVLPLSENPTAAAQGALAVEIKKTRHDLWELLKPINCEKTFNEAQSERNLLSEHGGGCHLALGMSVQFFKNYQVTHIKGKTPQENLVNQHELKMIPSSIRPAFLPIESWPSSELKKIRTPLLGIQLQPGGWVVSRSEALPQDQTKSGLYFWAAGVDTWKKLAKKGIWVQGCHDSLGGNEEVPLQSLLPNVRWKILTHSSHPQFEDHRHCATYSLKLSGAPPQNIKNFFWRSASDFEYVSSLGFNFNDTYHACGPGTTYDYLQRKIQPEKLAIFSSEENWRLTWQK
jgi:hydroxymethylbilane synthase